MLWYLKVTVFLLCFIALSLFFLAVTLIKFIPGLICDFLEKVQDELIDAIRYIADNIRNLRDK